MQLGATGLKVSRVGFGGIPIQRLSEADAIAVVRRCAELGITFFDTATRYTTSEERIGQALSGRREGLVLATKTQARDDDDALKDLAQSLRRLRTNTIDLWQLHNVSTPAALETVLAPGGALEGAQRARDQGTVRHIGITSHRLDVALEAVATGRFETVQFPFNYVTNEAAEKLIPLAQERGVGFIGMKPFAGGMLDVARLSIRYVLQFDTVLPDPGIQTLVEIEEIAEIVERGTPLTDAEQTEIATIRGTLGTRFCRRCGYCLPCEQGLRIPFLLNLRSTVARMPRELIQERFTDAIAKGRECIRCGACEERCPYHLPIREMITESLEAYGDLTGDRR
jgi:predicted aldo/keto reductase-like oxidoreductase